MRLIIEKKIMATLCSRFDVLNLCVLQRVHEVLILLQGKHCGHPRGFGYIGWCSVTVADIIRHAPKAYLGPNTDPFTSQI